MPADLPAKTTLYVDDRSITASDPLALGAIGLPGPMQSALERTKARLLSSPPRRLEDGEPRTVAWLSGSRTP